MQNKYQSPWFVEALQAEGELKINKLKTNLTTDICIIGGGFTGLWTALKIKEKKPSINICLLYTSPSPRDRQKSRMPSSA